MRDLLQPRVLFVAEWSSETHGELDAMNVAFYLLQTLLTILSVNAMLA